ncbi:MAG: DUF2127 domain-containing protein [Solirubrobacteraceae bacterium]
MSARVGLSPVRRHDRLLPWIAAERAVRAALLIALGIALVTHPHANWAERISELARHLGLNPNSNGIHKVLDRIRHISPSQDVFFGIVALAYGALEGVEAYGLFRRRRWGEWLTVIATSLLLIPEIWEIGKSATPLKIGGLIVNLAVVAYLLWRIRREDLQREAETSGARSP